MEIDLSELQKPNLFDIFKTQVAKDFELAGVTKHLPIITTNNLEDLKQLFYYSIIELDINNGLKRLLYRVDINELQIKQACVNRDEFGLKKQLAELIIKRILQKVVLKNLFSN